MSRERPSKKRYKWPLTILVMLSCCGLPVFGAFNVILGESLVKAASEGDLPQMDRLIRMGADINFSDENSSTPLGSAAAESWPEAVKFLLERGANPNLRDAVGLLPSQRAESPEVKKILLAVEAGSEPQSAGAPAARKNFALTEGTKPTQP